MRNTIIFASILFIATIVATFFYFKNLNDDHGHSAKSLRFLPESTLMIAAIGNDDESQNIFENFDIFDAILGLNNTKIWKTFKTKILNNQTAQAFTKGSDIYISFHPEQKEIVTLFTIPSAQAITNSDFTNILNSINSDFKTKTIDTLNNTIYQIQYGQKDSILNVIYYNDILFASESVKLLTQITDKHNKHLSDENIEFFLKDNPRNTPLSIYFPHQQYDSLIDLTQKSNSGPFINLFKKLQGQSAWNINFKEDALILTGESKLDIYSENYASIFKNQQKQKQHLYHYFPANTAVFAEFSVSDLNVFNKDLYDLFKRRKESVINQIDTEKTEEKLNKALGNEFAFLETNEKNYIGFIEISDSKELQKLNGKILDNPIDSIGRFIKSGTLYQAYGDVFKEFPRPYYSIIDSVLIVANSQSTLKQYRKNYFSNNLLTGTLGYLKLEKLQGNEANITIFGHTKNANSKIISSLNEPFKKNYNDKDNFGYQDFFSWSIQMSGNNGKIASQIYAIYKSKNILGTEAEWTYQFDERAITKPYVFEQSDTSQFILIQELDHTIYAIRPNGQKIWSKVFAGRVLGEIQQLEDRTMALVTDRNNLYRFDPEGNILSGFPVNIGAKAIDNPLISELNGQKAMLIPTEKKILAYTYSGTPIATWSNNEINENISTKIIAKDNHFIIGTKEGSIYWYDQTGKKTDQVTLKNVGVKNIAVIDNYKIVATDDKAGVNLIAKDGKQKRIKLASDSAKYYSSFMNNNLAIILGNELKAYTIKDSLSNSLTYNFTKPINDELEYFTSPVNNNQVLLGVASKATNLLYLFEENGQLVEGFPTEGRPLFYYGKINYNSDIYLLCMRSDHKLYAFRQKK